MARRQGLVPARTVSLESSGRTSGTARLRTCVGCRSRAPDTGLLRVVVVDGVLTPDPRRRAAGRGAWLHPDPDCLARAERRRAFPRALRVSGPLDTEMVWVHVQSVTGAGSARVRTDEGQVDPS